MSVLWIRQLPERSMKLEGPQANSSTITWLAATDNRYTSEVDIFTYGWSNSILPIRFQSHPRDNTQTCRRISCDSTDSPLHWQISAEYSSEPLTDKEKQDQEIDNPLQRPAQIEWDTIEALEAIYKDKNGNALLNSAGDYFSKPVEVPRSRWGINITKNVASVPDWVLSLDAPINASAVTIGGKVFPEKTLKLRRARIGPLQIEGDYEFYVFSMLLEFNRKKWKFQALDQGLRFKDGSNQKVILVDGQPATSDVLLNGSGAVLANPSPTSAVFLDFEIEDEFDFNNFPIA